MRGQGKRKKETGERSGRVPKGNFEKEEARSDVVRLSSKGMNKTYQASF